MLSVLWPRINEPLLSLSLGLSILLLVCLASGNRAGQEPASFAAPAREQRSQFDQLMGRVFDAPYVKEVAVDDTVLQKCSHASALKVGVSWSNVPALQYRHHAAVGTTSLHRNGNQPQRLTSLMFVPRSGTQFRSIVRSFGGNDQPANADDDDMPPVLKQDPRDFRARLVAAERAEEAEQLRRRALQMWGTGPGWVYKTTLLEQGSVLLSNAGFSLQQQFLHKSVILVLSHGDSFTKGIILNRRTAFELDGWPVWFGGDSEDGGFFNINTGGHPPGMGSRSQGPPDVTCLHQLKKESILAVSTRIVKDIYTIPFEAAKDLVATGHATKDDFWVFVGYTGWDPGQLQGEIQRENWDLIAADSRLLSEMLSLSQESHLVPRTVPDTASKQGGPLLAGSDGIGTWEWLAASIGQADGEEGRFADRMLQVWVLTHLSLEGHVEPPMHNNQQVVAPGDVLVSSTAKPFLLDKQYLHKAILIILEKSSDMIVAAVLNRPKMTAVSFDLPGKGPHAGNVVKRRVSYGGELSPPSPTPNVVPLHHRRELGGREVGNSGVFLATQNFTGEASDLMPVIGLVTWAPADLEHQIQEGLFSVVRNAKLPWDRVWELSDLSSMHADSLQERIADIRRREKAASGDLQVRKARALRMTKKSVQAWAEVVSSAGVAVAEASEWEEQLADEALFEWCNTFALD